MQTQLRRFFFGTSLPDSKVLNIGWLLFRIHIGLSIAIHAGWPKMNTISAPGWFSDQVAGLGFTFPSPEFWAATASWGEFIGGICIALGLLTRFSALQLAFQFFVIAFLWYDNPEPVTGMYFQQTLFFGYLLTVFAGGGKYSLDTLIMNRKKVKVVMPVKAAIACCLVFITTTGYTQTISSDDFKPLEGNWKGQLTYLDYSSNKQESIKANASVEIKKSAKFEMGIYYADEPSQNGKEIYRIKENGTMLNNRKVIERTVQADGTLKIVLEDKGRDGNDKKPATFHHELIISKNMFIITKMVKFDGEENFFQRNQYSFSR